MRVLLQSTINWRILMDDSNRNIDESADDIELVDIEDLRTAFGGQAAESTEEKPLKYPTLMCSGWA
jgi:hypothetical protein